MAEQRLIRDGRTQKLAAQTIRGASDKEPVVSEADRQLAEMREARTIRRPAWETVRGAR